MKLREKEEVFSYFQKMNVILKKIIDEVDVGVHVVDESGKTIIYNSKMMEIESMDEKDVLNKNLLDVFFFHDDQGSTLLKALQHGTETKNVKQTYFNNKGQEITTINHTFPVFKNGTIIGAVEIAKDVTKLERLMREKRSTEKHNPISFEQIIGNSVAISETIEQAKRATRTFSSVLIVGETGTGKELFAQSIHYNSSRANRPFISQNCAAIPDSLIESILFGTKRGAFTGAIERPGLFEQAEGGTILLDELNSLSPHLQAKLLRVIQEKKIRRIGDTKDKPIDVRIIATINEDPIEAIQAGRIRKDLYYRLGVVTLFIPPLRERKEDIPLLIDYFIEKYNQLFQMSVKGTAEEVMEAFIHYNWPGNVRELEHMIEGAMNFITDESKIEYNHLPIQFRKKSSILHKYDEYHPEENPDILPLQEQIERFEKYYIKKALQKNHYHITKTAKLLGLKRQSLQYRLKKYNIHSTHEYK